MSDPKNTHFAVYTRRVTNGELRPYEPGDDLSRVAVSDDDKAKYGCPKDGDMIARDPDDHSNQWLVSKEYFEKHYVSDPA